MTTATAARDRAKRIQKFTESSVSSHEKIDREAGVIYGVKVLGIDSLNRRTYSDKARSSAVSLYEEKEVFIDHRKSPNDTTNRGLLEAFGVLKNNRKEDQGNFADLHYVKSHPGTPQVLELIERGFKIGLSHDAEGPFDAAKQVVEDLTHVYSVDLVLKPATNKSLFESEVPPMRTIKQVLESRKSADARAKRLLEEDAMDYPVMDAPMAMEPVAEEPSAEQEVDAALGALVMAILAEKLSLEETLAKISGVLSAAMGETPAADGGDAAVSESVIQKRLDAMEHSARLREEIDLAGVTVAQLGPERYDLLKAAKDTKSVRKLLESWKPLLLVTNENSRNRPQIGRRLQESAAGAESYEASKRGWASKK